MFLRLYELTGSTNGGLLNRAVSAGNFLLRIQLPGGDFAGSVYNVTGPLRPPNYAATTSAILLWSKLYEVTQNTTWLAAAEAAALAVGANYLQAGAIQINGGELDDVMVNDGSLPGGLNVHGISGGTYGVMGLSQLAMLTKKAEHIALVRTSMDYMLAWQWSRDINVGYYNAKAGGKVVPVENLFEDTDGLLLVSCRSSAGGEATHRWPRGAAAGYSLFSADVRSTDDAIAFEGTVPRHGHEDHRRRSKRDGAQRGHLVQLDGV